jgi:hypothetical protein
MDQDACPCCPHLHAARRRPPSPPAGDEYDDVPPTPTVRRILAALDLLDRESEDDNDDMSGDGSRSSGSSSCGPVVGGTETPRCDGASTPPHEADPPPAVPPAVPPPLPPPPAAVPALRGVDHRTIPNWGNIFYLTFSQSAAYPRGRWMGRCPYHQKNVSTACTRTATCKSDADFDRCRYHSDATVVSLCWVSSGP